jgi:hypothetical protein
MEAPTESNGERDILELMGPVARRTASVDSSGPGSDRLESLPEAPTYGNSRMTWYGA